MDQMRGTTIVSVRRGNQVCLGGDGQVTLGNTVMKGNARKFVACTTGRYWRDLLAAPPMHLPCLNVLKKSCPSIPAN